MYNDNVICNCPQISHVAQLKYLGVQFDEYLTWKHHLLKLHSSLRRVNVLFYTLKKFMPRQSLITIYMAVYQSRLQYGIIFWGSAAHVYLNPILISQKFAVRSIACKPRFAHTADIFKELNILPLPLLYKKSCLQNALAVETVGPDPERNTRQTTRGIIRLPRYNKEQTKKTFLYRALATYNEMCRRHSRANSKKLLKNYVNEYVGELLATQVY